MMAALPQKGSRKRAQRPEYQAMPRCETCGKLCYPTNRAARIAIRRLALYGHTIYTYRCPDSGDLHLTHLKPVTKGL
jgi:hypothetical protein